MKFFSRRLATFVAIASVTCLVSMRSVLGQEASDAANPSSQDFESLNHGHKKHHGGHHNGGDFHKHPNKKPHKNPHKKPHKRPHKKPHWPKPPKVKIVKEINLVCDGFIIDKIRCPCKPVVMYSAEDQTTFDAQNNFPPTIPPEQVYVVMSSPCSKDLPENCTVARALAAQATEESEETVLAQPTEESEETILAKRADEFDATTNGGKHKKNHNQPGKHYPGKHYPGKHYPGKHYPGKHYPGKHYPGKHYPGKHYPGKHYPGKHYPGKHYPGKKHGHGHKHPYQNLCVAVGDFCGSKLYGCDFDAKTHYRCSAIGEPPVVILADAKICGGNSEPPGHECDCKCPGDGLGPVCGSQLHDSCKADPTMIYYCPNGPDTKPEVLKKCHPGTVCVAHADSGPTCGYDSCDCEGHKKYCSAQFPDRCGLTKNTVVKCVDGKLTDSEVCSDIQECIALADGAFCGDRSCRCPDDGTICGEIFPSSCLLPATSLYTCTKGESPKLSKDCLPGYCKASAAWIHAEAVFEALAKDVCIDECSCATSGPVCGSTFSKYCKLDPNTIYECRGSGSTPKPSKTCDHTCAVHAGGNVCADNDCTCPGTGDDPVCGHDLPASCAASLNTIYICRGGKGSKPEPLSECRPGTICIKKPSPEGASCGSGTCDCEGYNEVCSDQFLEKCELEKNTIYRCTPSGKPEKVETCDGSKVCVSLGDGAGCITPNCKCTEDGTSCGEIFPLSCKIKTAALYTCIKGEPPVFLKDCSPGRCSASKTQLAAGAVFISTAYDKCVDGCTCAGKGPVCGSTFNPECKLQASTLYKCDGEGSTPRPDEPCGQGGCTVNNGDDKCNTDSCTCPGSGFAPVCGSELPSSCAANVNTIYYCPGGSGTTPVPLAICDPGTICRKRPLPEGARCGGDGCKCDGDHQVCSDDFDKECGLEPSTIYNCKDGKLEKGRACDSTQECITLSDGPICVIPDCKCPSDGTVCGKVFPLSCKITTTALYTCKKGGDPVFKKDCYPDRCSASKASFDATAVFTSSAADVCVDKCTCAGKGTVCGSTFPPECKWDSSTLFKCDGSGDNPVATEECKEGGCIVTNGDNKCSNRKCTCPAPGTAPICGSDLPAECNADHNKIYQCPGGTGTEPKELSTCPPGSVCIKKPDPEGASCGGNTCVCNGDDEVCSSAFKDECGLEKNAIYKCTPGGEAKKVKDCDATEACVMLSDGAICTSSDCKCTTDGTVCGQVFPLACKIKTSALYTCVKGEAPIFKQDCDPRGCVSTKASMYSAAAVFESNGAEDKCSILDECDCQGKGAACGSTYPDKCAYEKDTIYHCDGATGKPTRGDKCAAGSCLVNVGDDTCGASSCTCPDGYDSVCGFDLPEGCKNRIAIDGGAIYYCPNGKGTLPEVQAICPSGLTCQSKEAPKGAACGGADCVCRGNAERCSDAFPADCGLKENTVYKCTSTGEPEEVETCHDGKVCITIEDEAVCTTDDCKCHKDGVVCGEVFPLSCQLKATAIYTCKDGTYPEYKSDCYPDRCSATKEWVAAAAASVFRKMADDTCTNACLCSGEGPTCGVSFPASCNLNKRGLYKCEGKGSWPSLIEECRDGVCTIHPGDDSCGDGDCKCIDTDDICGNVFPSLCGFKTNTIYSCENGAGSTPEFKERCPSNMCTAEIGDDVCVEDPCACKDDKAACGSSWPAACNYKEDTIYKCDDGEGTTPVDDTNCKRAGGCTVVDDVAQCKGDPCMCPDETAACGSTFPDWCGLDKDTVYRCRDGKGTEPKPGDKCKDGECTIASGDDGCKPTPPTDCKCTGSKAICGSNFDDDCKLDKGRLYMCHGAGEDPFPGEMCPDGACETNPAGIADKCKVDCTCPDVKDACGSTFPELCGLDQDTVYKCRDGKGTEPKPGDKCKDGECMIASGDDGCKPTPPTDCKCTGSKAICGSNFNDDCKLDKDRLYMCHGAGEDPYPDEMCPTGNCVTNPAGIADKCKDPCACKEAGRVCGSGLPTECKMVNSMPVDALTMYQCDAEGDSPKILKICSPGSVCVSHAEGADCGGNNCNCTGSAIVCSSEFADNCNVEKNTIYKCSDSGEPIKQETCPSGTECVAHNGDAFCGSTDCKCTEDGTSCGSVFPSACHLNDTSLYTCTKGGDPVFQKDCLPGGCTGAAPAMAAASAVFEALATDSCTDACTCATADDLVCGSTFPESCGHDRGALYKCTAVGAKPSDPEMCDKDCVVQPGLDSCGGPPPFKDECYCKDNKTICFSSLDDDCKKMFPADTPVETVLSCSGRGAKPAIQENCKENQICDQPVDQPAVCKDVCNCTGTDIKCSSEFMPGCNLPDGVYICGDDGKPEKIEDCTAPDTCKQHTDGPKCTPQECICKDALKHCGVTFDPKCNLTANTLHSCSAGDVPKEEKDCNPGVCSSNNTPAAGANVTAPATGSDDFCIDQCACKVANEDICSSTFAPACNLKANTLMHCDAINSNLTEKQVCTTECLVQESDDVCKIDPCACRKNADTCGNSFPPKCDYEDNTLYTCNGNNTMPVKKAPCDDMAICTQVAGGADVCGISNDCHCVGDKPTCGNEFPPKCDHNPDTLVLCPNTTMTTICPDGCADGACTTGCKCTTDVAVCGSSFADRCNLIPNAVYNCKNGDDPVFAEDCGDNLCIKGIDPTAAATCGDPCTCVDDQKHCATSFPTNCNLVLTALYNCTAPGEKPSMLENCTDSCEYTQPDNSCKLDCSPQVVNMSKQIDLIIEEMELLMQTYVVNINQTNTATNAISEVPSTFNPAGNITQFAYPPFIKTLDDIKATMMNDSQRPDALSLEAGTAKKTIIGAGRVFVAIQPLFPQANVNASLPMIQEMRNLIPLIDSVIACSGGNNSDCSGITQLWLAFNDQLVEYLTELAKTAGPDSPAVTNMTGQIATVTNIIDDVFKTRNDSTLPDAGKLLNGIIGQISSNKAVFQQASNPVNMYFEAAKEALKCEGFNITVFADKCTAYGERLQGGLANIIEWIQKTLNNIPIIGPIFTTPVLEALKQVVITVQNGAGEAVGKVVGMIVGIIQMFGLVPNADNTGDSETDGILAFLGILDVAGDCGGKNARCMGLIEVAKLLLQALVSHILGIIPFGLGNVLAPAINTLVGVVADALNAATSVAISGVVGVLETAEGIINFVFAGLFKDILRTFVGGIEDIARCLATYGDANDTNVPPTQSLLSHSRTLTMF